MDVLDAMKGTRKLLLQCICGNTIYDLVAYRDGSFGVVSDGSVVSVWEPEEEESCLFAFRQLIGLDTTSGSLLIIIKSRHSEAFHSMN